MTSSQRASVEAAEPPSRGGRDVFVVVMRALAMVGVVGVHVLLYQVSYDGRPDRATALRWDWLNWTLIWCVPWFVLCGGVVNFWSLQRLWQRTSQGRDRRREVRGFIWKRLKRMLIPYAAFAVIMTVLEVSLNYGGWGRCAGFGPKQALTWIVPFPHLDCLDHSRWPFWFLMFYIPVTLLGPLLVWIYRRPWGKWALVLVPTAIILVNDRFFYGLRGVDTTDPAQVQSLITPAKLGIGLLDIMLGFIVFFVVGFLYADGTLTRRPAVTGAVGLGLSATTMLMITVGPYTTGQQQFPLQAGYLFWGVGLFLVMTWARGFVERLGAPGRVGSMTLWVSDRSYSIYIWHMTALTAAWWTVYAVGLRDGLYSLAIPVQHVVLFALCWVYIWLIVSIAFRFESWDFPPKWWTRMRDGRRLAPAASGADR